MVVFIVPRMPEPRYAFVTGESFVCHRLRGAHSDFADRMVPDIPWAMAEGKPWTGYEMLPWLSVR